MRKLTYVLTASTALVVGLAVPASAAEERLPLSRWEAIASRGIAGTLTATDRLLLADHPDMAAAIPDETLTTTGEEPVTEAQLQSEGLVSSATAATKTCTGTNRYQVHKSVLGSIIFRYHSYVWWCYTSTWASIYTHYPYIDKANDTVDNVGVTVNVARSLGTTVKQTQHQNKIRLCVLKVGCFATLYPTNWVTVRNAPGSSFSWTI